MFPRLRGHAGPGAANAAVLPHVLRALCLEAHPLELRPLPGVRDQTPGAARAGSLPGQPADSGVHREDDPERVPDGGASARNTSGYTQERCHVNG